MFRKQCRYRDFGDLQQSGGCSIRFEPKACRDVWTKFPSHKDKILKATLSSWRLLACFKQMLLGNIFYKIDTSLYRKWSEGLSWHQIEFKSELQSVLMVIWNLVQYCCLRDEVWSTVGEIVVDLESLKCQVERILYKLWCWQM